jgi:hypothetical protein
VDSAINPSVGGILLCNMYRDMEKGVHYPVMGNKHFINRTVWRNLSVYWVSQKRVQKIGGVVLWFRIFGKELDLFEGILATLRSELWLRK